MIRLILTLAALTVAHSQYPQSRAPPPPQGPPPQQYGPPSQDYAPPPQPARQQSYSRPDRSPSNLIFRPADVHYVNIGAELAGDYKFGYDTGKANDGQSFREETRLPDGTVQGAYGYVDETGKQRIVRYTAGKDGFKAEGDVGPGGETAASPRAPPQRAQAPPQPAYSPPPQQAYRSPPEPAYRPPPQPAYRPAPQAAYVPPPQQAAYRPAPPQPQAYAPRPRPQSYAPEPEAYAPRPRHRRPSRPQPSYDDSPDYNDPNNEIGERRLAPIDTSLLSYNIGASHGSGN